MIGRLGHRRNPARDGLSTAADARDRMFGLTSQQLLVATTILSLTLGSFVRLVSGYGKELWLDELFSAAIATRPDFELLITRCLQELSGPVYYVTLWSWVKVAGTSNFALRFLSIAFSVAAPFVIFAWGHPHRRTRLIWAALTALWLPALAYAPDVRPYSLLILLAVGQTIALSRLLRQPSLRYAIWWSCLSALMILTHYHTLLIVGFQGLVIIWRGRGAMRWQAVLPFLPAAAWMFFHLPAVLGFASSKGAWYALFPFSKLISVPEMVFWLPMISTVPVVIIAATTVWSFANPAMVNVRASIDKWDAATALTGVAAVVIVMLLATIRPSFTPRYLLPFGPAILFGLAIWARAWSIRLPILGSLIILLFLLPASAAVLRHFVIGEHNPYRSYNFASASRYVAKADARRVIFLWDSPVANPAGIPMFNEMAGFELKRAGYDIPVQTLVLASPDDNPNLILPAAALQPGDAILWVYDRTIHDTLGRRYPAAIGRINPSWSCRNFGDSPIVIFACVQKARGTGAR